MSHEKTEEGLKQVIGIQSLTLTIVNFTIGSGIFVLPAIVGIELGSFAVFAYIFCSIMLAAIMLCYAEAGTKITSSGGSYAYVEAAFGPFPAFIVSWLFTFGWGVLGSAAMMNLIADSLSVINPVFNNYFIRIIFFFVLISFMIIINIRGAKGSVLMIKCMTFIKLLPLLCIILFGFQYVKGSNLHWKELPTVKVFSDAALVLFWAFAGFETSLSASGEIKNPRRTIPAGMLLGGIFVLIIYLLLQAVTQGVLGADMVLYKNAPLAAIAEKIIGPVGATLLLITAAVSCFGNISGDIFSTPRTMFASANDGLFPKIMGKVHKRFATPYWSIIIYGSLIFLLSVSGGFKQLAVLASAAILLIYLSVVLATIKLRMQNKEEYKGAFHMPGGILIPVIAIVSIVWLLTALTGKEIIATTVFISLVAIAYFLMKRFRTEKEILPSADITI